MPYAVLACVGAGLAWVSAAWPASVLAAALAWDFSWPVYLATALALFWYARGIVRAPLAERPARWRALSFLAGVLLLYAVMGTGLLYYAEHMFFLHRVHHLVLHHLGPFLIMLAWPGEALCRGMPGWLSRVLLTSRLGDRRAFRFVQHPVTASVLFVGLIYLWLWPAVQLRAMVDFRLFAVMNWSMVVDGILFFALVLDPRDCTLARRSFATRIVLAMGVQIPQIALGGLLLAADRDLYPWYTLCGRALAAIGPLADQQLGGLVVLFGGGMMSAVAALIVLARLWRAEEAAVSVELPGFNLYGAPADRSTQ